MPESGQTSFIPKRPITGTIGQRPAMSRSFGLLNVIAFLILLASLVFYGGSWFYRRVLDDDINKPCGAAISGDARVERCGLIATVEREQRNLDQNTIVLFQRLDNKFKIASDLLNKHIDILPIFALLEELTLPSIYYDSFSFTGGKGISLGGKAASYEDIAIQTQILAGDQGRIQSFIFSDLNTATDGLVTFKLTMILEPSLTAYGTIAPASSANPN